MSFTPHQHYKNLCKHCGNVLGQCRCMAKDKTIIYSVCDECKARIAAGQPPTDEKLPDYKFNPKLKEIMAHIDNYYGINNIHNRMNQYKHRPKLINFPAQDEYLKKALPEGSMLYEMNVQVQAPILFDSESNSNYFFME